MLMNNDNKKEVALPDSKLFLKTGRLLWKCLIKLFLLLLNEDIKNIKTADLFLLSNVTGERKRENDTSAPSKF